MESEARITDAKKTMRKFLSYRGKKGGPRVHKQAAEDTLHRLRSIEGICGGCENMGLIFFKTDGKKVVRVNCLSGHEPFRLYYDTPLGDSAECGDHEPTKSNM